MRNSLKDYYVLICLFMILFNLSSLSTHNNITQKDTQNEYPELKLSNPNEIENYSPTFSALNVKEQMILTPIFTPDNALDIYEYWIGRANSSIVVQNQYLTQFDTCSVNNSPQDEIACWATDSSPIVRSLVDAHNKGVNVRVQINEDSDSDHVTEYFQLEGISVRWMGNSVSSDGNWISTTHNKLVIIDDTIILLSSINFSKNAFQYNREAGLVIHSASVANYYKSIFESDWQDGEIPQAYPLLTAFDVRFNLKSTQKLNNNFSSPTNIPLTNFTDIFNVTLFTNPDNAEDVILKYLDSATSSIYVSMYTISNEAIINKLVNLKHSNPSIDIRVLISNRRVGVSENEDTKKAAETFVSNLIPVYNSTNSLTYYHNKYWIIDNKHTFVYSGNWSPRSISPEKVFYSSDEANRDMGIAIHDSEDIADFFKFVWDQDIAVASAWDLDTGIKQTCFDTAEIVFGDVTLSGVISGVTDATFSYRFNNDNFVEVVGSSGGFSADFDTSMLSNGINTFEVKAENNSHTFTDKVKITIANYNRELINWRVLITEVYPNPDLVSDTEGEFFELTNSFPFDVLLEGWKIGDNNNLHTFSTDFKIEAYSSIIIARNSLGFQERFGIGPDISLNFALANSNDYVQFLNWEGTFVDVVAYGENAPDNSEQLEAPGEGQSLQRSPLHRDTNTAKDFIIGSPNPKGEVPEIALTDIGTSTPLQFFPITLAIFLAIIIRRIRK